MNEPNGGGCVGTFLSGTILITIVFIGAMYILDWIFN